MIEQINRFGRASAIGTAAILLFSVAYNWGYFQRVGIPWISKLSFQDHLNIAPKTLPVLLLGLLLNYILTISSFPPKLATPLAQESKEDRTKSGLFFIRNAPTLTLYVTIFLGVLTSFFLTDPLLKLGVYFSLFCIGCFALKTIVVEKFFGHPEEFIVLVLVNFLFFLGCFAAYGYMEAHSDLHLGEGRVVVELNNGVYLPNLNPLIILNDGLLVNDPDCQCITYVPYSAVTRMFSAKKAE